MDEKPDKETIKLIKSYLKFLGNHIAIEKSILFGSRARGDYFITSDIDLIVVSSDFKSMKFVDRILFMSRYWKSLMNLEVLGYTPEEFERKKNELGIVKQAVKEGIRIK
ncbi:MAG: nucleotidyltransferase domain-containing protein [Candidatus Aenigmarchaeota archaeon]|nr:nucleotidyltransferase domain-containing protein [Candidatus Aenigmarchaeota archaeon]